MNFRFQNLLGAPYRGGNAVISGNSLLISPVGNRVSVTDLIKLETVTLPCESSSNISRIAVSPDGSFLLTLDENNRCQFVNLRRRIVLHRMLFKKPVSAIKFSPDGALIAIGVGKLLQIWRSPGFRKEFFPFQLIRTFADCDASVTALDWSPDSNYVLAGSKDTAIKMSSYALVSCTLHQVLLRRFRITHNLSLDGVLDYLNSKKMTEAGPIDLIDDDNSDVEEGIDKQTRGKMGYDLPGSMPNRGRPVIRTKCLRIAPTGRCWAAATTEGVLVYSIDESFIFDPTDLDMDVTPEAVDDALAEDQPQRALLLSLRLNEDTLIKKCIVSVKPVDIKAVALSIPFKYLQRLIEAFADLLESCPHLEFILRWCEELCKVHGHSIQQNSRSLIPALRSLQKSITRLHQDLADTCSSNEYLLRYLCSTGSKN
ncbi:periodic tryptophan protein 2-like [Macadamia integrifolia]|uniref:periodic tryptophan protein 2-like n=1 Tax=Macadamia integrifolia TaxID=60698 RepID=UPI001C4FCD63|nr:periodic tryptophan protein 2-like [Macadamia integrifolia]